MDFALFTKTCERDRDRFDTLRRSVARFLPGVKHVVDDTLPPSESGMSPYLWQQYRKLVAPLDIEEEWTFHVDSDMWFDKKAAQAVRDNVGLWVVGPEPRVGTGAVLARWALTNSWLLGAPIAPRSFMLETRGWWINREVLFRMHNQIVHSTGFGLRELLSQLASRAFSEYQLYASCAWHFQREAHTWLNREFVVDKDCTLGQDKPLFVRHVSSADEIRPEILAHQRKLLEGT